MFCTSQPRFVATSKNKRTVPFFCHRRKCLLIINTFNLFISQSHLANFESLYRPISHVLHFINPLTSDGSFPWWQINYIPGLIIFKSYNLCTHCIPKPFILYSLIICLWWSNLTSSHLVCRMSSGEASIAYVLRDRIKKLRTLFSRIGENTHL